MDAHNKQIPGLLGRRDDDLSCVYHRSGLNESRIEREGPYLSMILSLTSQLTKSGKLR
jgi:hypothetical protein